MIIKNIKPLKAKIEISLEDKCVYITDELGNVYYDFELFDEYIEDLKWLYDAYVLDEDTKLTGDAERLKQNLIDKITVLR